MRDGPVPGTDFMTDTDDPAEYVSRPPRDYMDRRLLRVAFALYMILLVWVVLFKCGIPHQYTGIPYFSRRAGVEPVIAEYLRLDLRERFLWQFRDTSRGRGAYAVLNVLLTVPLGIYLPLLFRRRGIARDVCITVSGVIVAEIAELFTKLGGFEILDVFCNTAGMLCGELVAAVCGRRLSAEKFGRAVNAADRIAVAAGIPLLLFAVVYTGLNFKYLLARVNFR